MTRKFDYWEKRGICGPKPRAFVGNAWDLMTLRKPIGLWLKTFYENAPNEPYFGIFVFDEPHLVIKSPEIIKLIFVKDFDHFTDRTIAAPEHSELFSNFMFLQKSPEWRSVRAKLSPTFTSGKLKNLFPTINKIAENLILFLENNQGILESKEVASKFSIDVIAIFFFGINAHCLNNENAKFRNIGREMFAFTVRNAFVQTSYFFRQELVNWFKLDFFNKDISTFFLDAFWSTVNSRKSADIKNYNFVDIVMEVRKQDPSFGNNGLLIFVVKIIIFISDGDKMAAHAFQFFAAGFETTASTIAFTLYELCLSPDIQEKLRKEIKSYVHKHKSLAYESINEMKYLNMCVLGEFIDS